MVHGLAGPRRMPQGRLLPQPGALAVSDAGDLQSKGARVRIRAIEVCACRAGQESSSDSRPLPRELEQVADRIWRAYGLEAEVVHPPVMIDGEGPQSPARTD